MENMEIFLVSTQGLIGSFFPRLDLSHQRLFDGLPQGR
jgi:hypothetical protein